MATAEVNLDPTPHTVPPSVEQVTKLTRYQLREYLRSRRFLALVAIVGGIGALITFIVAYYRGQVITDAVDFYGSFWGMGAPFVIVLAAVFFGGDAIAGEFQNKTGYFLMGLPLRRATIYVGKFIAAFAASLGILVLYLAILILNGFYYFGTSALPWQLFASLGLTIVYLAAVLGATFMFSSLFKTSAYGFVLTAILFLFGFTLLQDLITTIVKIEPWFVISYADTTISTVFGSDVNWGLTATISTVTGPRGLSITTYTAGIAEGIVIMLGYFVVATIAGLFLFRREEFN